MVAMLEEDTEGDAQVSDQTYLLMRGAFTVGFHRQVSETWMPVQKSDKTDALRFVIDLF